MEGDQIGKCVSDKTAKMLRLKCAVFHRPRGKAQKYKNEEMKKISWHRCGIVPGIGRGQNGEEEI